MQGQGQAPPPGQGPGQGPGEDGAAGGDVAAIVRVVLLAAFGPGIVWVVAFGIGTLLAPSGAAPYDCAGLGLACDVTPHDTLLVVGVWLGVLVVPVATGVTCLALLLPASVREAAVASLLLVYSLCVVGAVVLISVG